MALADLSDPRAVVAALDEFESLGRKAFLAKYGFGESRRYFLRRDNTLYDVKAIAAAAHGFQFGTPIRPSRRYTSGLETTVPKLQSLGFEVVTRAGEDASDDLVPGEHYSWARLGRMYDFEPGWLNRMGGMGSRPDHNVVLIITRWGEGRSFDYDDYWDGDDLVYTGHGQVGDQRRTGTNRYVGDNLRTLHAFETSGKSELQYLGSPRCDDDWEEQAPDRNGDMRRIIRFRLRFDDRLPETASRARASVGESRDPNRRSEPFDENRRPASRRQEVVRRDPAETAALQEKANQAHHDLLAVLSRKLRATGWREIEEIRVAIDLWARSPSGQRVIFEAKTLEPQKELARIRGAVAQLLEYRFVYGDPADRLCLVTNHPVSERRIRFLAFLRISVVIVEDDHLVPGSPNARIELDELLDGVGDAA